MCFTDPEGGDRAGRLHERAVPRVYWRHQRAGGHPQAAGGRARGGRHTRTCVRHDQQARTQSVNFTYALN